MNRPSVSSRGLWWKEIRQLKALVVMLLGVGLALMIFWFVVATLTNSRSGEGLIIPVVLPVLFAAGVSAIVVGQEKESRTIDWLRSLPISAKQIISIKYGAAVTGLLGMWVLCWTIQFLWSAIDPSIGSRELIWNKMRWIDLLLFHFHSVFLLTCGFYSAWKFRSPFVSLIAIVPLAFVPFFVSYLYARLREPNNRFIDPSNSDTFLFTLLGAIAFGLLAFRIGIQYLSAAPSPKIKTSLGAWKPTSGSGAMQEAPFQYPITTLAWHFFRQNRLALSGIVGLIAIPALILAAAVTSYIPNEFPFILFWSAVAIFLGVSWLGVFCFTGDASPKSIRFLAERGISPSLVFFSRHLSGISILCWLLLAYALFTLIAPSPNHEVSQFVPSTALIAILAWATYTCSQWVSQSINTLSVASFLAPLISITLVQWLGFAALQLDTPLWLILTASSIPMLASWLTMQHYMDGNRRVKVYSLVAVTVILWIILPIAPTIREFLAIPNAHASLQQAWNEESKSLDGELNAYSNPLLLYVQPYDESAEPASQWRKETIDIDAITTRYDERDSSPTSLVHLPAESASEAISVDAFTVSQMVATASYDVVCYQVDRTSETDSVQQWIDLFTASSKRLRKSFRLQDQEAADQFDIWLTFTLSDPGIKSLSNQSFYRDAVQHISDSATRSQARRRALLASWNRWKNSDRDETIDVYLNRLYPNESTLSTTHRFWFHDRLLEAFVAQAVEFIERGSRGESTEPARREMHDLLIGNRIQFEDGPYANRLQTGLNHSVPRETYWSLRFPGLAWYAPWESDAKSLAETLRVQPNEGGHQ